MSLMKRSTRNWLIGGGVVAAAAGGIWYYEKYKKPPPSVPSGTLTAGSITPVTAFTPGVKYTFVAMVPTGVKDTGALTTALQGAGWTSPNVIYFMGSGTLPPGFEGNTGSYAATGVWAGVANAPVPAGVIAAATP
jgi:hypothetical protein